MKILLVLPGGLNEVVCSTALIRCLKNQVRDVELHVLVDASFAFALQANPYLDQLHAAEKAHTLFAPKRFNALIDLAALEENQRWARQEGIPYISMRQGGFGNFVKQLFAAKSQLHLALQYLNVVQALGVRYDGNGMDYFIPQAESVKSHDIPVAHSAGYIALVLDQEQTHTWSVLQAFCRGVQHPLMLIGPMEVAGIAGELSAVDPIKVYSACGKFTVNESADLIRGSKLVIVPENGWMQVAVALKKPVVVLRRNSRSSTLFPPISRVLCCRQIHCLTARLL